MNSGNKDIFIPGPSGKIQAKYLKNKKSISKKCLKHSKVETLKKVRRSREGGSQTDFQIHNPYPIQDTPQQDTFNSQRNN